MTRTVWASTTRHPELNASLATWASTVIFGNGKGFGPCTTMGVVKGERLIAVVPFHNYDPQSGVIEISAAAIDRKWLTRAVLWDLFSFPFVQLGCQTVFLRVSPKPEQDHVRRMLVAYGCTEHRLPRLRGRDEDECVLTLHDDAWRANGFHPSTDISPDAAEKAA